MRKAAALTIVYRRDENAGKREKLIEMLESMIQADTNNIRERRKSLAKWRTLLRQLKPTTL